jgi:hypothetical protein
MTPPTYMLGVMAHEGSHALMGKMLGAQIVHYSLLPGFHPRTGKFYFGYVSVRGLKSDSDRRWFLFAPKITDALVLGSYGVLNATGAVPGNRYGHLALVVVATGFWVDFSKAIFAFWDHNDMVKIYNSFGWDNEWKRLPARLLHASLSAAAGFAIYRGYRSVFEKEEAAALPLVLPILTTSF